MKPLPRSELEQWGALAARAAYGAGAIARTYFRHSPEFEQKLDKSPVTIADQAIEQSIRTAITNSFPKHGIIGEEFPPLNPDAAVQWVIDPIDGTKGFMSGGHGFGTLIGVFYEQKPVIGVMYQPILNECWVGISGVGTKLNGVPVHTHSNQTAIEETILCISDPAYPKQDASHDQRFQSLQDRVFFSRYGMDCYAAGMLACGHVDYMVEAGLQLYDFAALVPIIEAAGGRATDWNGQALTLDCLTHGNEGGLFLASANSFLHDQALALLAK